MFDWLTLKSPFGKIDLTLVRREILLWSGLGLVLFSLGKHLDTFIFQWIDPFRSTFLDELAVFSTEVLIYLVILMIAGVMVYRVWQHPRHHSKLVPALFGLMAASISTYVLKSFFAIPRPFVEMGLEPLVQASSYAFPSGHTATAFALLIPFWRVSRWLGFFWFFFALFLGGCRVYELVHYPSDVAGGIFLGGIMGALFSHPQMQKWIKKLWDHQLEFRRQSFHFLAGFCLVFAHWKGVLRLREIALILLLGLIVSFLTQRKKIPKLSGFLKLFDRPRDRKFPGRGAFYFLLGVFLSFLLFPVKIAYAAILILSVGDSFNHFFATELRSGLTFPWNRRKTWWGVLIGIFMGTFAAQFFVPWYAALLASTIAILLETVPVRLGSFFIDDNLFVPLVAGGVLMLFV
jgi:undecaprenyl-diphosphatase